MKAFTFRLDRVLQLRVTAEQDQARRVAEARREEADCRRAVEELAARLADATAQTGRAPDDLRTAGTLGNLTLAVEAARFRWSAAAAAHREAEARLARETHDYNQARQARRALEKLRERRHEAWGREVERAEQQTIDEIALRTLRGGQAAE